jgi:hypothetical protein
MEESRDAIALPSRPAVTGLVGTAAVMGALLGPAQVADAPRRGPSVSQAAASIRNRTRPIAFSEARRPRPPTWRPGTASATAYARLRGGNASFAVLQAQ